MESPLTQGLVDEISDSGNTFSPVSNSPPVTPSPSITATPLIQTRENVKLILHFLGSLLADGLLFFFNSYAGN